MIKNRIPLNKIFVIISVLFLASCNRVDDKLIWQLKTDDTHLTIAVVNNRPVIYELKNPENGWNWTPNPSEVPLLNRVSIDGMAYYPGLEISGCN